LAIALLVLATARAAGAQDRNILRGYVTQLEVSSAGNLVRLWVAPEKGQKGSRDVTLEPTDIFFQHKLALARDAIKAKLPVKLFLSDTGTVIAFALRLYPSTKQLQ
jgi:hypothetical protein